MGFRRNHTQEYQGVVLVLWFLSSLLLKCSQLLVAGHKAHLDTAQGTAGLGQREGGELSMPF